MFLCSVHRGIIFYYKHKKNPSLKFKYSNLFKITYSSQNIIKIIIYILL